jgi:hypothetical protein
MRSTPEERQNAYRAALARKERRNTHAARATVVEARIAIQAHGERVPDYVAPDPYEHD